MKRKNDFYQLCFLEKSVVEKNSLTLENMKAKKEDDAYKKLIINFK